MRQIGVRDKAKLVGGLGLCGKELCCRLFLTSFEPISIKMAKQQELVLNTGKLSGVCGRLMCCLGYEYDDVTTESSTVSGDKGIQLSEEEELLDIVSEELGSKSQGIICCGIEKPPDATPAQTGSQSPQQTAEDQERHRRHKRRRRHRKRFHKKHE